MKKLFVALLAALGVHVAPVQAQSPITDQFDVNITLVPTCSLTTAPGNIAISYTANDPVAATGTTTFQVTCTQGASYTFTLENVANAALTSSGPGAVSISVLDTDLQLNYSVALYDAANTVAVGAGSGTGGAQTYTIRGTVAGSQAGQCATPACDNTGSANKTQELRIAY